MGRGDFEGGCWTKRIIVGQGNSIERHILQSRHHYRSTEVVPFKILKSFIASQYASWGDELVLSGEFGYKTGYSKWTEDILSKYGSALADASIYNVVYASLYTYDRLSGVFGGLPVLGNLFDEVVPSARELTSSSHGRERFLPQRSEYLFHAFHLFIQRSKEDEVRDTFSSLRIPTHFAEETYLAIFLSCWLCLFVLPSKSFATIRPSVFKMACFMAKGNQVGLAIPVLSNIYRGLNITAVTTRPRSAAPRLRSSTTCTPESPIDG
ncbi:hypothetical protein LIER_23105 [Lithospermum erythrorhizon]|uniref:Aminotransferase-like plant mobile domain-containing protein n=1 Tax=Lithospermum erythrorhizon TaxID=34254 RepID=A0AAV3QYT3_LITER